MIEPATLRSLVAAYTWVGTAGEETLDRIRRAACTVHVPAGLKVFDVGQRAEGIVLLVRGAVRIDRPRPDGRELFLYRIRPGALCAMSLVALDSGEPLLARGVSERECLGVVLDRPLHTRLCAIHDDYRLAVGRAIARRIAQLVGSLEAAEYEPVDRRLATLLESRGPTIDARHRDLAEELNTTRETVSRALARFQREGAVRLRRQRIDVIDGDRLRV